MAQIVKLKRSSVQGNIPTTSQIELGEVAINTYDGKMFIGTNTSGTNVTENIVEVGAAPASINDIGDVDTTTATPNTGDNLQWDGANWVPAASGGVSAINDLSDVDTSTTAPQVGDTLVWDGANWVPGTRVKSDPTGITGATAVTNIVQISQADYDNITNPDPNTVYIING